ncbi:MAG: hypothetical protein PEPC_01676 [Peptostreptococcus russellii]
MNKKWRQHFKLCYINMLEIYRMKKTDNSEKFITEKVANWYIDMAVLERDFTYNSPNNPCKAIWKSDSHGGAPIEEMYPVIPTTPDTVRHKLDTIGWVKICVEKEENGVLPQLFYLEKIEVEGDL